MHNSSDDDADIDGNGKKKNSFQKGSWALGSDGGKREDDAAIDGKGEEVNSFKKGSWALGSDKGKPKEMVARKKRKKVAAKVPAPGKYVSRPPPPTVIASEKARGVGDPSKRSALKQKLLRKGTCLSILGNESHFIFCYSYRKARGGGMEGVVGKAAEVSFEPRLFEGAT